jgi:hypothetical protein
MTQPGTSTESYVYARVRPNAAGNP